MNMDKNQIDIEFDSKNYVLPKFNLTSIKFNPDMSVFFYSLHWMYTKSVTPKLYQMPISN